MSLEEQNEIVNRAKRAIAADLKKDYSRAKRHYRKTIDSIEALIPRLNHELRDLYLSKKLEYEERLNLIEDITIPSKSNEFVGKVVTLVTQVHRPRMFDVLGDPRVKLELRNHKKNSLMLYGPKKNGKTDLLKSIAAQRQVEFISVDIKLLFEEYTAESIAVLKDLKRKAHRYQGSVIQFKGLESLSESARPVFCSAFTELASERALLTTSTAKPKNFHENIRRLFTRKIYVPLPSSDSLQAAVYAELEAANLLMSTDEFFNLCEMTEGFTFNDIKRVFRAALIGRLKEEASSDSESDRSQQLYEHLISSIGQAHPSTSYFDLADFEQFTEEFGSEQACRIS